MNEIHRDKLEIACPLLFDKLLHHLIMKLPKWRIKNLYYLWIKSILNYRFNYCIWIFELYQTATYRRQIYILQRVTLPRTWRRC